MYTLIRKKHFSRFLPPLVVVGFIVFWFSATWVLASTTDGTVDATNRYAWSENLGWIDFGSTAGNVHITDIGMTGYAWGENTGWISLNCSNDSSCGAVNYGVANNTNGGLS